MVEQNLEPAAVRSIMRESLGRRWDRWGLSMPLRADDGQRRASCSVRDTKNMIADDPVGCGRLSLRQVYEQTTDSCGQLCC